MKKDYLLNLQRAAVYVCTKKQRNEGYIYSLYKYYFYNMLITN